MKKKYKHPEPLHFRNYGRIEFVDEDFLEELYNDNTVAIVGPSNAIIGKDLGEYIDSFDTIVRLNKSIPLNVDLKSQIGSRVDVLYHALTGLAIYAGTKDYLNIDEYQKAKLKGLIITCKVNRRRIQNVKTYYNENYSKFRVDRLSFEERIPTRTINPLIKTLHRKMGTRPNTGMIAIEHVLTYPIKNLFICGFDFYDTFYYDGYGEGKPRKKSSINKHHNIDLHREYTATLYKENDHVEVDTVMQDIFERRELL